jgi:hypothetical protein
MREFVLFSIGFLILGLAVQTWFQIVGKGLEFLGYFLEQIGSSVVESAEPPVDNSSAMTLEILRLIPNLDQPHRDNVRKALKVVGNDLSELTRIRDKAKNLVDSKSKSAAS